MGGPRSGHRLCRWWPIGLLLLVAPPLFGQEVCLKQVFDRFCLGSDIEQLARQGPKPELEHVEGERIAYIFPEGPDQVYVLGFRGRVYKVVRRYRTATQLRYEDLYALLRGKYGPGEDRSRFPPYATSAARRLGSIRRGDGRAVHYWQPSEDWHIELSWTRDMGLALAYVATALDQEQQAAVEKGF